ncbi:MAG: hypothetical protein EA384_13500 [Spirochaetaceae bacterium]|nr:MAG: hypothetical protein EA384_13500 [Spirochaetaceae bacterium]
MERTKKTPKLLSRSYDEKSFRKHVVGRVYLAQDRSFLENAFVADAAGSLRLRQDLGESDYTRAVKLARQIRKNRGSLKTGRILALALIVGLIVVFNLLFKNALLTRAGQNALMTVFEAQAEIRELDLRLLDGTLSFANVAVADRDRPFRNLFEVGPTTVDIDLIELLKGNFVARTLSVQNIRWNTERIDSGRLTGAAPVRRTEDQAAAPGLQPISIPTLQPEDARDFVLQHYEQLTLPALIEDTRDQLDQTARDLPQRIQAGAAELDQLTRRVERAAAIRPQQIDSLESALSTYREIDSLSADMQRSLAAVESELDAVRDQAAAATQLRDQFSAAADADTGYLSDRITEVTADPAGFLMDIIAGLIQHRFADLLHYRDRARGIAALVDGGDPREPRAPFRPGGIDVIYPSVSWPRFYLGLAEVSFGSEDTGSFQSGSLREVSSAPRLIGRPTTLDLRTVRDGRDQRVTGSLSLHHERGELLLLDYDGRNLPVELSAALGAVSLRELSGVSTLSTSFVLDRDWVLRGDAEVLIADPTLVLETGVALIDQIISEAAAGADEIGARFEYVARDDRITSLRGSTTLDRHIAAGVRQYVDQQRAAFEARLRDEVAALVNTARRELEPLHGRVVALQADAAAEIARARGYRRTVEQQRTALDARVAELQRQTEQRAREEAQRQLQRAIEEVPVPRIDTDRVPRLR